MAVLGLLKALKRGVLDPSKGGFSRVQRGLFWALLEVEKPVIWRKSSLLEAL